MYTEIRFTLNGEQKLYQGDPLRRLLDVLREDYGLTGSKEGCGEGECGACSIIKNGELVTSCIIPVGAVNGCELLTIEGIRDTEKGKCIIDAYAEGGAVQCGFCIPGTPLETIDGVVVHYVGNPGTSAAANRSFFANLAVTHETYASAHFVVGLEGEVIQCVPLSEVAYCSSQANDHTVSIEVCHADETGEFSAETMASLLRLTAWLCEEFDLAPADVIRHYDVTGKICPKYYVDHPEAWEDFRSALRAARTQENPS